MTSLIRSRALVMATPPGARRRIDAATYGTRTPSSRRASLSLRAGAMLCGLVCLMAIAAPFVSPYAPEQVMAGARLAPPDASHWLGTDALGRDLFSRLLHGARLGVGAMALGVGLATLLGFVPGLWAGYLGGWLDQAFSRLMEIGQIFPGMLLALVIVARLGPSLENAVLALGIMSAPGFYRMARGLSISAARTPYVEAARACGAPGARIVLRHILPNVAPALIVVATMRAGIILIACSGLGFLGLGAQPPAPEWGVLLAGGRNYLDSAPWLAVFPGLCITAAVVGANLLGDGLRDRLDRRG